MTIAKTEYTRMKAKIEKQQAQLKSMRYELEMFKKKDKYNSEMLPSKRILIEDNQALEKSNQWFREKMAKIKGLHHSSPSYV